MCCFFICYFSYTLSNSQNFSSLKHPHLAEWKSLCTDTDLCLVTEYVDGINLQTYLQEPKNAVPMSWALEVAKSTAEAMAFLHSNNVVHRSLKPSNIIVRIVSFSFCFMLLMFLFPIRLIKVDKLR